MLSLTQRQVVLSMMGLQFLAALLTLIGYLTLRTDSVGTVMSVLALVLLGAVLVAYQRGWEHARTINVVFGTLIVGVGIPQESLPVSTVLFVFVPSALALVLSGPWGTLFSAIGIQFILLIRSGGVNIYLNDIRTIAAFILVIGCMVLSRLVTDTVQRRLRAEQQRAEAALARSEQQAADLQVQTEVLAERNRRQERLLDLVASLETPTVSLAESVVLAPLVGRLEPERITSITERLLHHVAAQRVQLLIIDIAGAGEVDDSAVVALVKTVQAVRLLGCRVVLTGISATVALQLSNTASLLHSIETARSPQDVLTIRAV